MTLYEWLEAAPVGTVFFSRRLEANCMKIGLDYRGERTMVAREASRWINFDTGELVGHFSNLVEHVDGEAQV